MTSVRRALALSFAERYMLIAIALLGNILVARLLTPKEIGIYSVSLAVIGIAQVLRDFGIGNFLVQEKNLSEAHIRTAFGFTLLIGWSLFVIVYFAAPFAGSFYGEDQMVRTMRISALNFLVLPFCSISLSLLRRAMAFNRLVTVSLGAAVVGFTATISLAYAGFGPNSMAIGAVVSNIVTGAGAWMARTDRKLLLPGFSEWRVLLNFGGQSSLSSVITTIAMDANDLVVGKVLGFYPVAILSRAQGIMNLFHRDIMSAVRGVALPAFASAHRKGEDLDLQHTRSVAIVTAFAWPFYGLMSAYALETTRLLFGLQWDSAVPLVPIFCLVGAISSLNTLIPILLIATGHINIVTRAEILLQLMRLILVVFAVIFFRSIEAYAVAFLIATTIAMPVFFWFKQKALPTNFLELRRNLISSFLVALTTLCLPALQVVLTGVGRAEPIELTTFCAVIFVAMTVWIVSIRVFHHPICCEPMYMKYFGPSGIVINVLAGRWR
ncbi:MAG: lipopolysaccharide biosynthesis protein [Candidatus Competibacteraceae bacterium]|nr:lipopolysaccharide biosynthesis protein [Candidatus Competibacteraceae bacterium]